MDVGVVGKPNVGKSTFFKSLTLSDAEVANFPFTTVKANIGVGYVRGKCPCRDLGVTCNPNNSLCRDGVRFIPVKLIDVAGLVPGAHEGKGLGNQFLDDLRQASALIHVVDISGRTNELGEPSNGHDPAKDIVFLEDEVNLWFADIIERNWKAVKGRAQHESGKMVSLLSEKLSGLGVSEKSVEKALSDAGLLDNLDWSRGDVEKFAKILRERGKTIIIAANKIDLDTEGNFERLKGEYELSPVCAEAELALREASEKGLIDYMPGVGDFTVKGGLGEKQLKALEFVRENILKKYGSTGVQDCLDKAVYEVLEYISVYPVENEKKYSDKNGRVLPDAHLMPKGSTVIELAYKIHSDIGGNFVGAIDCRSGRKVGRDHELRDCDVIKIHARV
ncbi:MAG TPA: redox-regulated ATPase YchF [Candidatus Altiarchaeales archaeon]|nr:redox-regulated ATPase YchF [Candidatus Altiarchaeales archaeon]